jgi:hypothetical protein
VLLGSENLEESESCRRVFSSTKHPFSLLLSIRELVPQGDERLVWLVHDPDTRTRVRARLERCLAAT